MESKYVKKPVIITAVQYREEMRINNCLPDGVYILPTKEGDMPVVHTLEGDEIVRDGDYIITGVQGEKYPCKPHIFEQMYEEV